jgi:hypothetical protein
MVTAETISDAVAPFRLLSLVLSLRSSLYILYFLYLFFVLCFVEFLDDSSICLRKDCVWLYMCK